MKRKTTSILTSALLLTCGLVNAQSFTERMGDATGSPAAAAGGNAVSFWESNNRFDNDNLTMTGSTSSSVSIRNIADVQGNHVFISRDGGFFTISNINSAALSNMQLSFKLLRGSGNPNNFPVSSLRVEVSADGTNWTQLGSSHLSTNGIWQSVNATGSIPAASNLRIRFSQPAYAAVSSTNNYFYRIDDVQLFSPCTSISLTGSSTDVSCNGGSNGAVNVSVTGSTPISYSWSNGATSEDLSGVSAGTYTLSATNACGTVSQSFTVDQPELLEASSNATSILCNGGSSDVTVSAAGGTLPYSGVGVYNVGAGSYAYTVTDGNGCQAITFINITEPALLEASSSATAILCNGGSSDVTVSATGGTLPYSGDGSYTVGAGSYSYTVTDANGCTASTSVTITEPPLLIASSAVSDAINCFGETGVITVTASGGTPSYSGTGDNVVTAGTYTFEVTDANGCTASTTTEITEPALLTVDAGSDETVFYGYGPMQCADLSAAATGGTPAYSYSWSSMASGGGIGSTLTACPTNSEIYTVTVSDANGCIASDDLSICVVDVHCEAGNSGNMKVEMCQIPPGNPANAHTICIDASAVPAHLAIGCQLGACGEQASACSGTALKNYSANTAIEELQAAVVAYPNPTENTTTISVTLTKGGNYSVEMFDMMGKLVKTVYAGSFEDYENLEFDVDMTNLNTGVYMISVSNGDQKIENIRVMKN